MRSDERPAFLRITSEKRSIIKKDHERVCVSNNWWGPDSEKAAYFFLVETSLTILRMSLRSRNK
jgi:hypothetical protein